MTDRTREIIGTGAGILTTSAFIPQVYHIWSRLPEPAEDVSALTFFIVAVGVTGWLTFAVGVKSKSMMISNGITLVLYLSILLYKLIYG
ncbi:MAG: hypothetical protein AAB420_00580 [Patescibacteria group bacterium]